MQSNFRLENCEYENLPGVRNMSLGKGIDVNDTAFPNACTNPEDKGDFCYNTTFVQCKNLCDKTTRCMHANYCGSNNLCYLYPVELPEGKDTPINTTRNDDCFTTYRPTFCNYETNVKYGKYILSRSLS